MSTRCQIGFYEARNSLLEPNILLYRHSDGMPTEVLKDLVPFLKTFHKHRGINDLEYLAAWTMHHLIDLHVQYMQNLRNKDTRRYSHLPADGRDFVGYGIDFACNFHGDIEWYYAIRGINLCVYSVNPPNPQDNFTTNCFKLVKTVKLTEKSSATKKV